MNYLSESHIAWEAKDFPWQMTRFIRTARKLGLDPSLQLSLLGCSTRENLERLAGSPDTPLRAPIAMRIELLGHVYKSLLKLTGSYDEILEILFSPRPEAPFFGAPPIRFLQDSAVSGLGVVADYFESNAFQSEYRLQAA